MKDALLIELAQTWELQASTGGDGSNMLQPATRETLRQCADILRMLVAAQPAASSPAPAVQPLTMGRIYEAWHEIGADVAGLSWAKFAEALQHGQPQGGSNG